MSKHTHGPWRVGNQIHANIITRNMEINACFTVIEADGYYAGGGVAMSHIKANADESNANASLIAAAPDLLAALEAIFSGESNTVFVTGSQESLARAAIAKAKGVEA